MRSARPTPENQWPHDMVLRISEQAHGLMELLWVREAWALQVFGDDLPPRPIPLPQIAPSVHSLRRDKREWEHAWPRLWTATVDHEVEPRDPYAFETLRASEPTSPARAALLTAMRGPSWRGRFGDAAFDDGYDAWAETLRNRMDGERPRLLHETPERMALPALIPAWERGLLNVVTIPCPGTFTRTVGEHGLLVTEATRADPESYSTALRSFTPTR